MNALEQAKKLLPGHSIVLVKDKDIIISDGRGISPMIKYIEENKCLENYSCADLIVGKAVAMLFVKTKIKEVYGEVMSKNAYEYLVKHNISCSYKIKVDSIINRSGTDICPMEKVVLDIDDVDEAYTALIKKIEEIKRKV